MRSYVVSGLVSWEKLWERKIVREKGGGREREQETRRSIKRDKRESMREREREKDRESKRACARVWERERARKRPKQRTSKQEGARERERGRKRTQERVANIQTKGFLVMTKRIFWISEFSPLDTDDFAAMTPWIWWWMAESRLVGSLKLQVSFAKEPCKSDYVLRKRPVILRGDPSIQGITLGWSLVYAQLSFGQGLHAKQLRALPQYQFHTLKGPPLSLPFITICMKLLLWNCTCRTKKIWKSKNFLWSWPRSPLFDVCNTEKEMVRKSEKERGWETYECQLKDQPFSCGFLRCPPRPTTLFLFFAISVAES